MGFRGTKIGTTTEQNQYWKMTMEKIGKISGFSTKINLPLENIKLVIPIVIWALGATYKTVDWMALLGVAENKYSVI